MLNNLNDNNEFTYNHTHLKPKEWLSTKRSYLWLARNLDHLKHDQINLIAKNSFHKNSIRPTFTLSTKTQRRQIIQINYGLIYPYIIWITTYGWRRSLTYHCCRVKKCRVKSIHSMLVVSTSDIHQRRKENLTKPLHP